MFKVISFLAIIAFAIGSESHHKLFEFTIRGTVIGQDSGQFYLFESSRIGDEITIPFRNHQFEYKGTALNIFNSTIGLNHNYIGVIIEPGEIILELHADSLVEKSKVIKGFYNLSFQQAKEKHDAIYDTYDYHDYQSSVFKDQVINLVKNNSKNYAAIYYLYSHERNNDYFPIDLVGEVLEGIEDKELKKSREYIKLYSIWRSKKDSINMVGQKAMDFKLLNVNKEPVSFHSIANKKLTYVEKSGSWCGNSTNLTRELIPIYEKYKEKGFEVITIVPEFKLDRWEKWLKKEQFPWTNLVELDDDFVYNGISITDMLFRGYGVFNYLVDTNGVVIASDISSDVLNEMLMKEFEPENYDEYIRTKWNFPEGITILDKEDMIDSLEELTHKLSGKPFFIDCWATWCKPCIEEFKYSEQLEAFLKSKGIEMVYINFDYSKNETTWLNAIRKYNLKGYHMRENDSFDRGLMEFGFEGSLPRYMIVDSEGKVVVANAFRPSQQEQLFKQIEDVIVKKAP